MIHSESKITQGIQIPPLPHNCIPTSCLCMTSRFKVLKTFVKHCSCHFQGQPSTFYTAYCQMSKSYNKLQLQNLGIRILLLVKHYFCFNTNKCKTFSVTSQIFSFQTLPCIKKCCNCRANIGLTSSTLKTVGGLSKALVRSYETIQHHIPEDLQVHKYKNYPLFFLFCIHKH